MVFLMETKVDKDVIEKIRRKIQFADCHVVPRQNRGGGLALLWTDTNTVDVLSSFERHIDVVIDQGMDDVCQFTGFYGNTDTANREDSWSLLKTLSRRLTLPWIVLGDFNEILRVEEKQGWLDRSERQIRRPGTQNTWIRLDRGVATIDWILRFPTSRSHHLDAFHSDHKPILLISDSETKRFYRKGRPFRFEAMWLKDKTCEGVIKESWSGCLGLSPLSMVPIKLTSCQINLQRWNREVFGHVRLTLARKLKELTKAEEADLYRSNQRNKRNFILGFEDDNGVWTKDEGQIGELVEEYFSNLFSTSNSSGFDDILKGISPIIMEGMNTSLNSEYTAAEVAQALHQMAPLTAPSLDSMSPIFYKSFWHIVGDDVTNAVLAALNSGIIPDSISTTFISLIPKI
ncbi:uncharacterized protein LOC142635731 [Castanea sativa]|uniref:uncharacterized protein LOC142635731 n=1 Tax=Castanea sativa TaxID=21020 RepID=UPI003F653EB2